MSESVTVTVTRQEDFRFLVEFGPQYATMIADEPMPIGVDSGPSPQHLLAAAIANCLCASLTFACRKYHEDPGEFSATVTAEIGRNERNRLRVQELDVRITLNGSPEAVPHLARALATFEDFCTVTESVRHGIDVKVSVFGPDGAKLH
ncbi:MAG: OsmC family protein [Rhodospirillales bacterium]|nr:OsmC family protein [Rhodospirillales bacterium]MDE2459033.1 OsmC family protein [Rhodospirillales bacterium]